MDDSRPGPPLPDRDYLGFVERADASGIAGWAINRARLPGPAHVALLADGVPIAITPADQPRPDVAQAGFPTGQCGYTFCLAPGSPDCPPPCVVFWPDRVPLAPVDGVALAAPSATDQAGGRRLGIVTSWSAGCGIADYARHIARELAAWFDIVVFAREAANASQMQAESRSPDDPTVALCWQDSDFGLELLCDNLAEQAIDKLLVEHHPGLMAWPRLARLIEFAHASGIAVFVRLHTVRGDIASLSAWRPALRLCAAVLVHTESDAHTLAERLPGIGVRVVAHGIATSLPRSAATDRSTRRNGEIFHVGAFGFLHLYKNVAEHLQALHILRRRLPGLRATLLHAITDDPATGHEAVRCFSLRQQLGLADIVDLDTHLLSMEEVGARLGGCDILVFPYRNSAESASGAAHALAGLGIPLLCTQSPIFADMQRFCHVAPGQDSCTIACKLFALASDRVALRATLPAQAAFVSAHAWRHVAAQTHALMANTQISDLAA
jgi:glycosyltransferase involved in cell wall biosynthesis